MSGKTYTNQLGVFGVTLFVVVTVAAVASVCYFFFAQTTPSHVYQITEEIIAELELFQDAQGVSPERFILEPENIQPRHVMIKARDVLSRLEEFKAANGFETVEIPEITLQRVTPTNVRLVVHELLAEVKTLRPKYGIEKFPQEMVLEKGKTPLWVKI